MTKQIEYGNSMVAAQEYARVAIKQWERLMCMEKTLQDLDEHDVFVTGFSMKPPDGLHGSWLITVRASNAQGKFVAFHSEEGFVETLVGLVNRLKNGSIKWKEDQYAK